jgi:hypothetical protein
MSLGYHFGFTQRRTAATSFVATHVRARPRDETPDFTHRTPPSSLGWVLQHTHYFLVFSLTCSDTSGAGEVVTVQLQLPLFNHDCPTAAALQSVNREHHRCGHNPTEHHSSVCLS